MTPHPHLRGALFVLAAGTLWGGSATWAQYLQQSGVGTLLIVQTRVTISAILLVICAVFLRRDLLRIRPADWWRFALLGIVGIAGANFAYYYTMSLSTVATGILLQYLAPLAVVAYGIVSHEEILSLRAIVAAVLSLAGCYLAVGGAGSSALAVTPAALAMGLVAMACFAFMTIFTRHLLARYPPWTVVIYGLIGASCFWLLVRHPGDLLAERHDLPTWGALGGLALSSVLLPYICYFSGLRTIPASRAIITSTLEPVVAIATAALFLGETLGPWQTAGAVLVIVAIVIVQMGPTVLSAPETGGTDGT